jgi:hypothetical protein
MSRAVSPAPSRGLPGGAWRLPPSHWGWWGHPNRRQLPQGSPFELNNKPVVDQHCVLGQPLHRLSSPKKATAFAKASRQPAQLVEGGI